MYFYDLKILCCGLLVKSPESGSKTTALTMLFGDNTLVVEPMNEQQSCSMPGARSAKSSLSEKEEEIRPPVFKFVATTTVDS